MKLIQFRVQNYRSITDSGEITVAKLTSLVGRNEAGKSNLLRALQSLNPPGGAKELSRIKDFPRQRRLSECTPDTPVITSTWELTALEQTQLATKYPRAKGVTRVDINRPYKAFRSVGFVDLPPLQFAKQAITDQLAKIKAAAEAEIDKREANLQAPAKASLSQFVSKLSTALAAQQWAAAASPAIEQLKQALSTAGASLPAAQGALLTNLTNIATRITNDEPASQEAKEWVLTLLPVFIYVDEYPELTGHQNIAEYLSRKANPTQLTDSDKNFEKMCKVADLDPKQLNDLHAANDHETRNQLANRASAIVTSELRRLWKDASLKVRFNLDAHHLDTFVSDPNSIYDVEVNLDERSRGLKWFFSFYITFAADTKGGSASNAILLLDEPGLYLHALSQGDLLQHLENDFENQIIYTTHSPFMVPTKHIDNIRTVSIAQDKGTTVSNDPAGDSRTLFPLQAALGYSMAQSLFIGPNNLIVEGVTDFWMLTAAAGYLESLGKKAVPSDLTITPAGGAQKIPYMVALLTSESLKVIVLFDDEKQSRHTMDDLLKAKLIRTENVVFATDAYDPTTAPSEADTEDLFDESVYGLLVQESYSKELQGKTVALNSQIPRIVKRYEDAFKDLGIEFHKTRPARLMLTKMGTDAASIMTPSTVERFERLFEKISHLHSKNLTRDSGAFR